MTIEQAIEHAEQVANSYNDTVPECECAKEHRQLAAWLRELVERRKAPEIVHCGECKHNGTQNCLLNLWATIFNSKPKDDFYCGMAERAERRTDEQTD